MKLEDSIKQKSFKDPIIKAFINVMHTSSWIYTTHNQVLKPFDLSVQQFNILRILKGQYPNTSTLKNITHRMIDRNSNTSRLVDKLIDKEYVERKLCDEDRRRVDIVITKKGLQLIEEASKALESNLTEKVSITQEEAEQLSSLLDKARAVFDEDEK
jgi:DNA-binding MarR family transcriptional regulator